MKIATGLLCLAAFLIPQQATSERTVALIFRDPGRVEMIAESAARTELAALSKKTALTVTEFSRRVALELALGTTGQPQPLPRNTSTREFLDNEIRRGVRKPLQADNYYPKEQP